MAVVEGSTGVVSNILECQIRIGGERDRRKPGLAARFQHLKLLSLGIHTGGFRKIAGFSRKIYQIIQQTLQCSQEYLKSFPTRRFKPRTENYPILKAFLFF